MSDSRARRIGLKNITLAQCDLHLVQTRTPALFLDAQRFPAFCKMSVDQPQGDRGWWRVAVPVGRFMPGFSLRACGACDPFRA
jgi:hypothetical protein